MKYWIFAFVAISVLLVSCGPQQTGSDISPFVGGTQGLLMSFVENAPPPFIYDNGGMPFSVIVQLTNSGEAAVGVGATSFDPSFDNTNQFGVVRVVGISPTQYAGQPGVNLETLKTFEEADILLDGAKRIVDGTIIAGTTDQISLEGYNYKPDLVGDDDATIRAELCYDYSTKARAKICIKSDTLENVQDSTICTLSGLKDVQNSGAPVQVTSVTESPLGKNKLQVTFVIENVGGGIIFRKVEESVGSMTLDDVCNVQSPVNPDRNVVKVKAYIGSLDNTDALVECTQFGGSNEGPITLYAGTAATVVCKISTMTTQRALYTDNLYINLEYAYFQFAERPIIIKDVSQGPTEQ